jgi:hypothetical protein
MDMAENRWSKRIPQSAVSKVAQVRDAVGHGAEIAAQRAGAVSDSVRRAGATIPELVSEIEGPELPLHGEWSTGLGRILSQHPSMPGGLRGTVAHLDRLGQIRISPEAVGFDGEQVRWSDVSEIKFGPLVDVVTSQALDHEIRRITALLPPVPGRSWLVRQAADLLVALCLAAAGSYVEADPSDKDEDQPGIPVAITYRKRLRTRDMTPGLFVALVAASAPTISQAITSIARERGVAISNTPPSRARRQALALREIAGRLSGLMSRPETQLMIEEGEASADLPIDIDAGEDLAKSRTAYDPAMELPASQD